VWALANRTPYAADRNWTRDKNGVHWWIVAVRATFSIAAEGKLVLADEQLPPLLAPEHHGPPESSSLRYDSDLLGLKPTTDVLVLGSAHAPGGRAVASLPVVLRIGALEKTCIVHGERVYYDGIAGLTTTSPLPFVTRPIRYELAFGGSDTSDPDPRRHVIDERNPVGRGIARHQASLIDTPAHAIEYPNTKPGKGGPAGFGPISPAWLPRRVLAGTYDDVWARTKKPLLPNDYDPAFALCAPADQRSPQPLRGGERLGLIHLSPAGLLAFELPTIRLELHSRFGRKRVAHDPPMLATVLVEPDEQRLSLVWQSGLRVAAPETEYLDQTEILER
jgi:hypothetical protein